MKKPYRVVLRNPDESDREFDDQDEAERYLRRCSRAHASPPYAGLKYGEGFLYKNGIMIRSFDNVAR